MGDDVREIGRVKAAGTEPPLVVYVNHGTVDIGCSETSWRLTVEQADELAAMLITALWQAAAQAGAGHG